MLAIGSRARLGASLADGWYAGFAAMLLDRGANPGAKNRDGATALYISALWGNVELAELLLAAGAAVDDRASDFSTPLHLAAQSKQLEFAALLLDRGTEVNTQTEMKVV